MQEKMTLFINGKETQIPVIFVINNKTNKIILRPQINELKITVPSKFYIKRAFDFAVSKTNWIEKQLQKKQIPDLNIDEIIFLDKNYKIQMTLEKLGVKEIDGVIFISGNPEFKARRLKEFLKNQLQKYCEIQANKYCKILGKKYTKIVIKNVSSRHGSCSSLGNLCFSDKLIFAPCYVINYVIAHEVSHLCEMNHGDNFWEICKNLYEEDIDKAKLWLKLKI